MVKIAIPTDDGVTVSRHFGQAKYLLIVEPGSNWRKLAVLEQKGQRLARAMKNEGVREVVCYNIGTGMSEWLGKFGIRVTHTDRMEIDSIIRGLASLNFTTSPSRR